MMPAVVDYGLQPYLGTDVVAFVMAIVSLLYLALWQRDGERGMGWFALGMGSLALWVATHRFHVPVDRYFFPSPLSQLAVVGIAGVALGLVDYLDVPAPRRRRALWFSLLPIAMYSGLAVLATLGLAYVPRIWANLLIGLSFTVMGLLALWASRREPQAGHSMSAPRCS